MFYLSLKPETIIVSNKVIKKSNFKIVRNINSVYFNKNYYYVYSYQDGIPLNCLPFIDVLHPYMLFLSEHARVINGNLFLPFDDVMNLSNFVIHNNIIKKIDCIDDWWCCYGNITIETIIDCLLTNENKIRYIYKLGYCNGQQCCII